MSERVSFAEKIIAGISSYFGVEVTRETKLGALDVDWADWLDVIDDIDKSTNAFLDIDMDAWDDFGGNPSPTKLVNPELTVGLVVDFLDAMPHMTFERVVLKVVAKKVGVDTDLLPYSYQFREIKTWAELRRELNEKLSKVHNFEIDQESWNELARQRVPSVSDIIEIAQTAYTAEIA